jgi:AcrR family transcriptional regulator
VTRPIRREPAPGPPAEGRARAVTARGERTREQLLDAAERLWGERGVDGVSLREIRIAAGQRNSSALQFHFGDRSGLLLALAQRHLPRIGRLQEQLYAALVASGRGDDLAGLIEVLVGPTADYLRQGPSERAWVKISAEQAGRPDVAISDLVDHAPAVALHVGSTIHQRLTGTGTMDPDVAVERMVSMFGACNHLCADRARFEESPSAGRLRPALPFDRWRANLVAMAVGALTAPAATAAPPAEATASRGRGGARARRRPGGNG